MQNHTFDIPAQLPALRFSQAVPLQTLFDLGEHPPRILFCDGQIESWELLQSAQPTVSGIARLTLYTSSAGALDTHSVQLPFRAEFDAAPFDLGDAACSLGQVHLRREGEQGLRAQATVDITLTALSPKQLTLIHSIREPEPEMRLERLEVVTGCVSAKTELNLQEDVQLDRQLPEVEKLLSLSGCVRQAQCQTQQGEALITGQLELSLLYRAKQSGQTVHTQLSLPLTGSVRNSDLTQIGSPQLQIRGVEASGRIYPDVEGQDRLLHISARIPVTVREPLTQEVCAVADAYCTDRELTVEKARETLACTPLRRWMTQEIALTLPREEKGELQPLLTLGWAQTEALRSNEEGIKAEICLQLTVLAAEESGSLRTVLLQGAAELRCDGIRGDADVVIQDICLSAIPHGDHWEITGSLGFWVQQYPVQELEYALSVQEGEPFPREPWACKLLCVQEGEDLFSVARRARIRTAELCASNPELQDRPLAAGEMLLVER